MVCLILSESQAELLKNMCDMWLEGMEDATKDVEEDRSLPTVEDYLEALSGMHMQFADVTAVREKLRERLYGHSPV